MESKMVFIYDCVYGDLKVWSINLPEFYVQSAAAANLKDTIYFFGEVDTSV